MMRNAADHGMGKCATIKATTSRRLTSSRNALSPAPPSMRLRNRRSTMVPFRLFMRFILVCLLPTDYRAGAGPEHDHSDRDYYRGQLREERCDDPEGATNHGRDPNGFG